MEGGKRRARRGVTRRGVDRLGRAAPAVECEPALPVHVQGCRTAGSVEQGQITRGLPVEPHGSGAIEGHAVVAGGLPQQVGPVLDGLVVEGVSAADFGHQRRGTGAVLPGVAALTAPQHRPVDDREPQGAGRADVHLPGYRDRVAGRRQLGHVAAHAALDTEGICGRRHQRPDRGRAVAQVREDRIGGVAFPAHAIEARGVAQPPGVPVGARVEHVELAAVVEHGRVGDRVAVPGAHLPGAEDPPGCVRIGSVALESLAVLADGQPDGGRRPVAARVVQQVLVGQPPADQGRSVDLFPVPSAVACRCQGRRVGRGVDAPPALAGLGLRHSDGAALASMGGECEPVGVPGRQSPGLGHAVGGVVRVGLEDRGLQVAQIPVQGPVGHGLGGPDGGESVGVPSLDPQPQDRQLVVELPDHRRSTSVAPGGPGPFAGGQQVRGHRRLPAAHVRGAVAVKVGTLVALEGHVEPVLALPVADLPGLVLGRQAGVVLQVVVGVAARTVPVLEDRLGRAAAAHHVHHLDRRGRLVQHGDLVTGQGQHVHQTAVRVGHHGVGIRRDRDVAASVLVHDRAALGVGQLALCEPLQIGDVDPVDLLAHQLVRLAIAHQRVAPVGGQG